MVAPRKARQFRFQNLLAALLIILVLFPVFARYVGTALFLGITFTLLLIAGVVAAGETRRRLWAAAMIGAPMLIAAWGANLSDSVLMRFLSQGAAVVFYVFLLRIVLRAVFSHETVEADTLYGAACGYLLIGMAWTSVYALAALFDPQAFAGNLLDGDGVSPTWPDLLYFSFATLTTLGYGDITPAASGTRSLATVEATTGVLYTAIVVARLVGLYRGNNIQAAKRPDGHD
jgi:hypothetical protein